MLAIAFIKPGTGLGKLIYGGDVERNGCSVEPLVALFISLNKTVQLGSNKTHWGGGGRDFRA
jgi:hypothetical protein